MNQKPECDNCGAVIGSGRFCNDPACSAAAERHATTCFCGAPATQRRCIGRVIIGAEDRRPVEYRERYEMCCSVCADEIEAGAA